MSINKKRAKEIAEVTCNNQDEKSLVGSFIEVCSFLSEYPEALSWRGPDKPSVNSDEGLEILAIRYFDGYRRSDFPAEPSTVPDEMVSVIMEEAYGYSAEDCQRIKVEHQQAMCSEGCVGNLLERYLDSVLRQSHWNWCCGDFVKAIDFIGKNKKGEWIALQIKNRDNSENSSSSAIRDGTIIQKWFRTFSKDTKKGRDCFTNWGNLPSLMQNYGLNEDDFKFFVKAYISNNKPN